MPGPEGPRPFPPRFQGGSFSSLQALGKSLWTPVKLPFAPLSRLEADLDVGKSSGQTLSVKQNWGEAAGGVVESCSSRLWELFKPTSPFQQLPMCMGRESCAPRGEGRTEEEAKGWAQKAPLCADGCWTGQATGAFLG